MISEKKLKAFVLGGVTRRGTSKKENEEAKQKEEKEAVGKAYQEFVDTFQGSSGTGKTWIKAGTFDAGRQKTDSSGKGSLYRPKSKVSSGEREAHTTSHAAAAAATATAAASPSSSTSSSYSERRPEKPGAKKKTQEKKKSNLESFKEELKAIQEEREERHRVKSMLKGGGPSSSSGSSNAQQPPSRSDPEPQTPDPGSPPPTLLLPKDLRSALDFGDPSSTNLYLGNLSPRLTEQQLMEIFGKYGPLASIKIMWPRTEDEKSRGRNCGFVAYMSRIDGERALNNLSGKDVDGFEMKMGWGKPVPIPLFPLYIPPKLLKLTLPPPPSGLPFNAQCSEEQLDKSQSFNPPKSPSDQDRFDKLLYRSKVKVVIPTDRTKLCFVNRMIEFVIREGPLFEAMIMNREMNNPNFRFLFENQSPEHIYYRWRLYSILQGDSKEKWSSNEFRMFKGGSLWVPPPLNLFAAGVPEELLDEDVLLGSEASEGKANRASDDEEELARNNRRGLSDSQRDRFEEMLRNLVPDRNPVAESMVWCMEHADAGEEIVDVITESLSIQETPLGRKIARLYLISDILHNCSLMGISNVSYFRKGFQAKLPLIFSQLHDAHRNISSRIKAEAFKQRINLCFRAWEDWALYPQDYLIALQNNFLGLAGESFSSRNDEDEEDVTPTHQPEDGSDEEDAIPLDGAALLKSAAKTTGSDKMKKIPITKDSDDSDLDGAPLDDPNGNGSGNIARSNTPRTSSGFMPSKWEAVDPEDVQAQAVTSKWDIFDEYDKEKHKKRGLVDDEDDIDGVPLQLDDDDIDMRVSESRRSKLRDIEIKVMSFQDELETGKRSSKSGWTISEQVEHFRKKLMRKEFRTDEEEDHYSRSRKRKNSSRRKSSSSSRSRSRSRDRSRRRRRRSSSSGSSPPYESRRSSRRSRSPKKHKKKRH